MGCKVVIVSQNTTTIGVYLIYKYCSYDSEWSNSKKMFANKQF